ncbi:hypothetical protein [Clostridium sp. ATCC 25772]|uniref:hypothetical protein n=1 Tax=Clostridium sp. ATCC 25772 TaxID=1676991 RepID=UPI000785D722|nr:hypothetical protein [Clostridium sp. ATCC 25772]
MICFKCGTKVKRVTSYCDKCGAFIGYNDKKLKDRFKGKMKSYKLKVRGLPIQMKVMLGIEIMVICMFFIG